MRSLIFWLLLLAFGWFVYDHQTEAVQILAILETSDWRWLSLVILCVLGHYLAYAKLFQVGFSLVNFSNTIPEIYRLLFAALAINVVTPTGGTATTILFMDYASTKGASSGKAGASTTIIHLARLTVLTLLTIGIYLYLAAVNRLFLYQIIGSIALMVGFLYFSAFLWLGYRFPVAFHRFIDAFRHVINAITRTLLRKEVVTKEWVELNTAEYSAAARLMADNPWFFAEMLGLALAMYAIDLVAFSLTLIAFGQHLPLMAIVSTYLIGMLFWVASPTPQGIGVVEGVMSIMLIGYGLDPILATSITLAFRGLTFWVPLLIGIIVLRTIPNFKNREQPSQSHP